MELIKREIQSDLDLGEHSVRGEEGRVEHAIGIGVLAYLLLIRACHQEINPSKSWTISQLQHALHFRVITNQVEHQVKGKLIQIYNGAS